MAAGRMLYRLELEKYRMPSKSNSSGDLPVVLFKRPGDWSVWLDENHSLSSGVWLRLAKKDSGLTSVSYAEALEVALCYGWIDGQKRSLDDRSWLQKFTPRGARSIWSKINREKVERLIEDGRMQPAGLRAVELAKQNGRWDAAYDSQSVAAIPDDLQAELNRHPKAKAFFATLESKNRYAILFRIQTAKKAETRARRIQQFIEMLERHEKIHS
jgi:uncharacterized protein YdeI (YjbR/CyaY-like superfamily)